MREDGSDERFQPLIKVWRMHPAGVRIEPADPVLGGQAPPFAQKYCGPYLLANGAGFYLYSPIDIDLTYDPHGSPIWTWTARGAMYDDDELIIMRSMKLNYPNHESKQLKPRTKLYLSGINDEPQHTAQIWTGCVFQTPPGWALWIRSPINRDYNVPFRIEEAILETDWFHYDIWMNLRFTRWGITAAIRRDGPPLAQIIPISRQAYSSWSIQEKSLDPENEEAQAIFDWWLEYNWDKFFAAKDGRKDQSTYHKWRKKRR